MIQLMVVETVTLSAEGAYSDLGCFLSKTILTYFYFRSITFYILWLIIQYLIVYSVLDIHIGLPMAS